MKLSEAWLREWVDPELSTDELVAQLTMAGLEVDGVEAVAGSFEGVVVGEIVSVEPHPDADKLRVCQVAGDPQGTRQVVCGAPNARVGIKVPFALVGAQLPGDFKIKKAKLRGVESFGMLCAQTELEAGEDDHGLWELPLDAPVGQDLQSYLQLQDRIIEVDLTPNRSDCLSIKGLAREVAVLNRCKVSAPAIEPAAVTAPDTFPVTLSAPQACSRYVGRVIRNIDVARPSPLWLQEKLRRSGLRSIDAVVDVTNYVLLELGQPMHAFDLAQLNGGINVRMAKEGERLVILGGQELTLKPDTLVIADAKRPLALAGIMGGEGSGVTGATQHIFLESAFFNPLTLAGRARNYGLHTDSSHRFERGVDYQLQVEAMERATALLLEVVGGEAGPVIEVKDEKHLPKAPEVTLRRERITGTLGLEIADEEVEAILLGLGLSLAERSAEGWVFQVPSYRFDLTLEVDLLEELARIYGYNRLPKRSLAAPVAVPAQPEGELGLHALRRQLVARGFQEAVTYSFLEPELNRQFDPERSPVMLKNPISADMAAMRTSLLPGLVKTLQHNLNRQQERVRLFESGLRFVLTGDQLNQEPMLAGLIYGSRQPEGWANNQENVDFYDIKGDLEALIALTGADDFRFKAAEHPGLHPGQCAAIYRDGRLAGYLGAVHPQLQQALDIPRSVYVFEVAQWALLDARVPAFKPLSRHPLIRRDLALLLKRETEVEQVLNSVKNNAGEQLVELKVFDVYMGKGIDPQRKSVALGLTFQHPSRTLAEDEINAAVDRIVQHLQADFEATLR